MGNAPGRSGTAQSNRQTGLGYPERTVVVIQLMCMNCHQVQEDQGPTVNHVPTVHCMSCGGSWWKPVGQVINELNKQVEKLERWKQEVTQIAEKLEKAGKPQ